MPSRWLARLDALFGYDPDGRPAGIHPARPATYLAWAEAIDRPDGYRPWPRPEPAPAARGAADAAVGLQHRAMAARSLRALCAAHPRAAPLDPLEAELGAAERGSAPARCARRIPEGPSLRPAAGRRHRALRGAGREASRRRCSPPRPNAPSGGRASSAWRAGSWPPRTRAAPPARTCWRAKRKAPSPSARPAARCASRRAPTASTRSSPAAGRSSTTRPAACPRPRSWTACSRRSSCSRRRWPSSGGFEKIKGKARAVHLSYWQANGLGDGGEVKEIKDSEQLVPAMLALVAQDGRALRQSRDALCRAAVAGLHPALQRLRPSRARRRMVDRGRRRGMSAALDPLALATDAQRRATTPGHSAWVEANAGTGKTKVLTDRVTRLLLDGVKPERILCLTFTKAAAAEMRNRLASQLGRWALAEQAKLDEEIEQLIDRTPDAGGARRGAPPVRARARCAGRHQHPHHPRLLPGAAEALPARGRRGAGLRGAGRGRGADPAASRPGRADGGAGPPRCAARPGRCAGRRRRPDLDRRIRRAHDEASGRARLAAGAHRRRSRTAARARAAGRRDGLLARRHRRRAGGQRLPRRRVRRREPARRRTGAGQGRQAGCRSAAS